MRLIFIRYPHKWNDRPDEPGKSGYSAGEGTAYVAAFVCPEGAKVKERMVYACARTSFVSHLEELIQRGNGAPDPSSPLSRKGSSLGAVLELADWADLTAASAHDAIHPPVAGGMGANSATGATKPKPKRREGTSRLVS